MNINRDNYEEYFVLYIDKELNASERALVESFVEQNPDLKHELEMLQQTVLSLDEPVSFMNKETLFKSESTSSNPLINELNCEEYFILYADNELNNKENALVEEFIYSHPQYQENFELLQQVKFQPEKAIIFPDKSLLYRSENDHKVVPMFTRMRSWKMAAAAAVLLMISGTVWYSLNSTSTRDGAQPGLASTDKPSQKKVPAVDENNNGTPGKNKIAGSEKDPQSSITENTAAASKELKSKDAINDNTGIAARNNQKNNNTPNNRRENTANDLSNSNDQSAEKLLAQAAVKKDKKESNINNGSNVQQQRDENKKASEIKVPVVEEKPKIDESMALVDNHKPTSQEKIASDPAEKNSNTAFENLSNENDEVFETTPNKKNRSRGFFRKVTRVFDKVTSKEPSENRKGLHIASFAIDLK